MAGIMELQKSSCGFCVLVFCSLFIIVNANINQNDNEDDEAWIDPFDMLNYDPTTKRMRNPSEPTNYPNVPTKRKEFNQACDVPQCPDILDYQKKIQILLNELDELKIKNAAIATSVPSSKPVCLPVFKRFLAKLLKETSKLGLPDDGAPAHYDAEVKLSKQSLGEIQKLLNEDGDLSTGAMDDALSQILLRFKLHDHEAWKWKFEDTFYVEADTVLKVSLIILLVVASICTELWSVVSWFVQFRRMFAVCFFISLIWNWFHLYMLAFADHKKNIVEMESFNAKCTGVNQLDWKDSLSEWYRRTWTLQDDPCKKYYEALFVNPLLIVAPTKALTVTITNFFTDPLKHIGEGISEFLRALLKELPVTLQVPVLLIIGLAIIAFMYGSAQAAIHQAVRLPALGFRRDPPPPPVIGQHLGPPLRQHEELRGAGDGPQRIEFRADDGHWANRAANPGDQGFRGDHGPEDRQRDQNKEHRRDFSRATRVETVRAAGSMSSDDELDLQRETQDVEHPAVDNKEVNVEENKQRLHSAEKKEEKDTSAPDSPEPLSELPPLPTDVKTLRPLQSNEGTSPDAAIEEESSSFRHPVQETSP